MMFTQTVDLAKTSVRALNQRLHELNAEHDEEHWRILNPRGAHAIACGLRVPVTVEIEGHAGYYCAGMNQKATVIVHGNVATGVAENMMSGIVHVNGNASQCAGATAHGGLLVVEGDASARCGISMKGIDIVVKGSAGHMSAFMAQTGNLVILFVRGGVRSLGTDCIEKEMRPEHLKALETLLKQAGCDARPEEFRRYGSARKLYHFQIDNASLY